MNENCHTKVNADFQLINVTASTYTIHNKGENK